MKIAHLCANSNLIGGVESYLHRLTPLQVEAGNRVLAVSGMHDDELPAIEMPRELVTGFHEYRALRDGTERALAILAEFDPEIVHVHEVHNIELLAALSQKWPTIKHAHVDMSCAAGGRRFFRRSRRACYRALGPICLWHYYAAPCGPDSSPAYAWWTYCRSRAALEVWPRLHKLVTNSAAVQESYVASGIDPSLTTVLHYFAPTVDASREAHRPADDRTVLFAGRLVPGKGLDDLLHAMTMSPSLHLAVVGNGIDEGHAHALSAKLGLTDRVEFVGWQENVEPYYQRASLLVVPSLWPEPFGIVGIEAMARALPVVAYRSGGIPEWLDDGVTGLLVEPGNIEELAAAIDEILSDPDKARRMGEAGRERQRELFSPQPHLKRLEEIYEEAIEAFHSR